MPGREFSRSPVAEPQAAFHYWGEISQPSLAAGYNTPMDGLENQLGELLASYSEIKLALLFGSQATGTATGSSDIDIALLADTPLSAEFRMELIEKISMQFGQPVDIVDLFYAPEPVLGQALHGKRLIGDASTYAGLLTRHVLNAADFIPLQRRILKERRDAWINR